MLFLETGLVVLYGLCLVFMLGFSLTQWQLARLAGRAKAIPPPPAPAAWPRVAVQLPVYNELNVVARLIDAAAALDYPADRLHIQVLDDSTDETGALAAARVAHYRAQGLHIAHVRRPTRRGYKAGALAHGLAETDAEFIAIFDADFLPAPDFLRRVIPYFTGPDVGMVQTRWGHLNENDSLLTRLQAFGLNAHFLVEQVGRQAGGHFLNFNGTGGVWRRSCIVDAGGWHADTLTEDLDLSYRAQLRGWRFRYLPQVVAPAELPAHLDALRSQQHRWNKGAAETARKHLGRVWRAPALSLATKLHATFHLLNSSVFAVILLMALLSVPLVFVRAHRPEFRPVFRLASGFCLTLLPLTSYYYAAWRRSPPPAGRWFAPTFALFIALSMGLALHNARAVVQGLLRRSSPFVRTPKLGAGPAAAAPARRYRVRETGRLPLAEALLTLYFLAGLAAGCYYADYGLLPFHALLVAGFGTLAGYAWHERRG
ncbi:cellulose synthase family protein [Hymenobacter caeli]|uniref:Cellulose synthase/poly-beta-1,6-N-acetylglucosamine synthase-like glycosyltransferase n=1 Tax=Hymenobacter caeli TaxID=2735894 RepID=A0ABX2FSV9_9BACT|nr:cellulose synthase family protein [Hymenobacter caeli]NRT19554.1 cellulose synthase/poly-beta-1,6-N-acetylglucosamine synthase-like glycosyltransferase [Hymenobacter caeli]